MWILGEESATTIDIPYSADVKNIRYSLSYGIDSSAQHGNFPFSGHSSTDDTEIVTDKDPEYGDIMNIEV